MTVVQKRTTARSTGRVASPSRSSSHTIADRQHPGARTTYDSAVANGFYTRDTGGLNGKHDNVRRFWEDRITRHAMRGFVERLVGRIESGGEPIRVLDLGAGSGEGYELLTGLRAGGNNLTSHPTEVLPANALGCYRGIDISSAMVAQGHKTHFDNPKVDFRVGDLSHGLGEARNDPSYDLYFSSYGSLSHLQDDELERLIVDIFDHGRDGCVFVADLLGRFSFEWPGYWRPPADGTGSMRSYSMSYLYPTEMLERISVERFPVRYWGADEFDRFVNRIIGGQGGRVSRKVLWDRSLIVGRHMNTGEYNRDAQPVRAAVNRLHADYHRTDLRSLLFDYAPQAGFPDLNRFFERFAAAWNAVVLDTIESLIRCHDHSWLSAPPGKDYPEIVRESIRTIRNVILNVGWFDMDDPLANVVEPQLGYTLRKLEMRMQKGLGTGHGLLAIYQLEKN